MTKNKLWSMKQVKFSLTLECPLCGKTFTEDHINEYDISSRMVPYTQNDTEVESVSFKCPHCKKMFYVDLAYVSEIESQEEFLASLGKNE